VRLIFLLLISTSVAAQEARPKPAPKKVAAKAHAKATPEQVRKFNQLEKQKKK